MAELLIPARVLTFPEREAVRADLNGFEVRRHDDPEYYKTVTSVMHQWPESLLPKLQMACRVLLTGAVHDSVRRHLPSTELAEWPRPPHNDEQMALNGLVLAVHHKSQAARADLEGIPGIRVIDVIHDTALHTTNEVLRDLGEDITFERPWADQIEATHQMS
jgi:hypothetical protein